MSFSEIWSYTNNNNWKLEYPSANGENQSPININKTQLQLCDVLCDMSLYLQPSKCILTVKNNTPIIYFSTGSYIKKTITKEIFSLKMMTIHTPSLHAVDGVKYELEVVLYFKLSGNLDPKSKNYIPGGVAMSFMFERNNKHTEANDFLNAFIYQIPNDTNNLDKNIDINVGDNWTVEMLLPEFKSYYYYEGSLPFPPCEENWTWLVFEEIQPVSSHILDVIKIGFQNNIRDLNRLNNRKVSYNDEIKIINNKEKIEELTETVAEQVINEDENIYNGSKLANNDNSNLETKIIKIIVTLLIILLVMFASLKMTKYLIVNDFINKILVPSVYSKVVKKKGK